MSVCAVLQAKLLGFKTMVKSLDAFLEDKEAAQAASQVLIVSSTYNGTPPDNAGEFIRK
jgi:sulfite reductase alpha subunit-like flavoprotein